MERLKHTVLVLAVVVTGIVATAVPASAAERRFDFYHIISGSSGLCLSNLNQNGRIVQDHCKAIGEDGVEEQLWTWQQVAGDNMWKIRNFQYVNTCISTLNGGLGYGTPLEMWGCTSSRKTLRWNFLPLSDPLWRIKCPWNNGCFEIVRPSGVGAAVVLGETNWDTPDEVWQMRRVGSKTIPVLPY